MSGGNYYTAAVEAGITEYQGLQKAAADETQAKYDERNRITAINQASAEEDRVRASSVLKLGVQRAAIAQSGFDTSSVGFDTLQAHSAGSLELDALTVRYRGAMEALNWQSQRDMMTKQAHLDRRNAHLNAIATYGSSMGGGGNVNNYPTASGNYSAGYGGGYGGGVGSAGYGEFGTSGYSSVTSSYGTSPQAGY